MRSAHVAELDNGKYLVRRIGMNHTFLCCNAEASVFNDLHDAINDIDRRVEFVNYLEYKREIRSRIIKTIIIIGICVWIYFYYFYEFKYF